MNPLQYIIAFARSAGGAIIDGLIARPNFNDMANLSITSPSNGSATFNGTSDYIDLYNALNFTTESITISFWVNTTLASSQLILTRRKSGVSGYEFGLDAIGKISFYIDDGTNNAFDTPDSLSVNDGYWHYVSYVVNRDDDKVYRYVDGSNSGTNTSISSINSLQQNIQHTLIGGRWNDGTPTDYFKGNLANVAIWNRALTSDEINSVMWKQYQDLNTQEINGLQAWYSLDSTEVFDWYNYAQNQGATIEGKQCVDNALNALAQL